MRNGLERLTLRSYLGSKHSTVELHPLSLIATTLRRNLSTGGRLKYNIAIDELGKAVA